MTIIPLLIVTKLSWSHHHHLSSTPTIFPPPPLINQSFRFIIQPPKCSSIGNSPQRHLPSSLHHMCPPSPPHLQPTPIYTLQPKFNTISTVKLSNTTTSTPVKKSPINSQQ
ncbi:hypothetical protein Hanom_Chr14g01260851 [Helianthus anomalus]